MILTRPIKSEDFEKVVNGELTFYVDEKIEYSTFEANVGDYIALNELLENSYGRSVLMEVSAVSKREDCYIYALQPCRVEPHRRLTAEVYGGVSE